MKTNMSQKDTQQRGQQDESATFEFYASVDPETGQPTGLFRWVRGEGMDTLLERFDPEQNAWVDHPALLAATGIGGDNQYERITEAQATALWQDMSNSNEVMPDNNNNQSAKGKPDESSPEPSGNSGRDWFYSLPEITATKGKTIEVGSDVIGAVKKNAKLKRDIEDRVALIGKDDSGSDVAFWNDMLPPEIEEKMIDFINKQREKGGKQKKKIGPKGKKALYVSLFNNTPENSSDVVKGASVHVRGHWRWVHNGRVWVREYYREGKDKQDEKPSLPRQQTPQNMRPMGSFTFDGGNYSAYYDTAESKVYLWHDESKTWVASAEGVTAKNSEDEEINDNAVLLALQNTMKDAVERDVLKLEQTQQTLPGIKDISKPISVSASIKGVGDVTGIIKPVGRVTKNTDKDTVLADVYMWDKDGNDLPTVQLAIPKEDYGDLITDKNVAQKIIGGAMAKVMIAANNKDLESPEELTYENLLTYGGFLSGDGYKFVNENERILSPFINKMKNPQNILSNIKAIDGYSPSDFYRLLTSLTEKPFGKDNNTRLRLSQIVADDEGVAVYLTATDKVMNANRWNVSFHIGQDNTFIGLVDLSDTKAGTGNGAGAEIIETIEALATPSNITALEANMSVGGYAWAVMGYDFADMVTKERFATDFANAVKEKYGDAVKNDPVIKKLTSKDTYWDDVHSWDIATWKGPDGEKFGKTWLLGTSWDAVKFTLDDEIGEHYYQKRLGENADRHILETEQ